MYRHGFLRGHREGGWVALAALIVVVIIMLITINTYLEQEPATQKPAVTQYIDNSDHVAVATNVASMNQTLQMMMIENPGKQFTIEELRQRLNPTPSRSGGEYVIGTDNKVYHTGFPDLAPPADMLPKIIHLQQ